MKSRSMILAAPFVAVLALGACGKGANNQTSSSTPPSQIPPGGPLKASYDCAKAKPAAAPPGSPPDDVLGVRLGMPVGLAEAILSCGNSNYGMTRNSGSSFDLPTIGQGPQPDTTVTADGGDDKVEINLLGMPGEEYAVRLAHSTTYPNGKPLPAMTLQRQSLITKYGQPTSEEKSGSNDTLHWIYELSGQPMSTKNPSYDNCTNGGGLGNAFSFNKGCGLTIWGQIQGSESGGVDEIDLSIMNQANIFAGIDKEKAAIAIRNAPTGTTGKL